MARFCTYCGSPLEEGQACVCTQQAATADPSIQQTISVFPRYLKANAIINLFFQE